MPDGQTSFNVAPGGGDPYAQLLEQVRQAAEGAYDILGEMGRSKSGNVVYLARELESGNLVAMKLSREAGSAGDEFNLEVVRTLDGSVPGLESKCPECKGVLPDFDRFCFRCGADLSGIGAAPGDEESAAILEAVKEATAGEYDIVGKMDRADGGGVVFFARDLRRDRLVALRLKQDQSADPSQASYSIGETQVFRPLAAELGATQVAPAGFYTPPPAPSAAPPPVAHHAPVGPPAGEADGEPAARGRARAYPPGLAKKVAIGVGALLLVVVAIVAFTGGDDAATTPVPPPVAVEPPPAPDPDPATEPEDPEPEPLAPTADSGTITVGVALPSGARLSIDGRAVRGARHRVASGTRVLALAATGFEPVRERVQVGAEETVVWRPQLTRVAVEPPPAPPPPAPQPPPPPAPTPTCARAVSRSEWSAALELCRTEAQAGNATAQRNLAKLYDDGTGVAQDRAQAAEWYQRAAAGGNRESQERLGYLYREGLGVRRDERQSATYFRQAAEGGLVRAQLEYGVALEDGKGVSRNQAEAAQWYEKASAGGSPHAARRLGRLYERGNGVRKDEAEAAKWYRTAGDRGDAEAQYYLGRLYKDGKGVPKSAEQALEWFRKAAAQGHRYAANEARRLEP